MLRVPIKFPCLNYSRFSQISIVSKCPYLFGKTQAKICKNNNSIFKAFLTLKLHVTGLDPAEFTHDLTEQE
mgnify:CR=1 FL=1